MQLTIDAPILAKAMRLHIKRKRFMRIFSYVVVIFSFIFIAATYSYHNSIMRVAFVGLLIAIMLLMSPLQTWIIQRVLQRQFRQMAEQGDDVTQVSIAYDATGITFTTQKSSARIEWSAFTDFYHRDNLLLLYRNSRYFQVLPLAQMSEEDINTILSYLQTHLTPKG